jgi:very-short-patch-repair endonuclease
MDKVFFSKHTDRSYLHPDRIYANFIKPLIWEGLVCKQIMRSCNITENTIKRFIYTYGSAEDISKIKSNFKHIRSTVPKLICRRCDSYYPLIKSYILKGYTAIETRKTLREKHDIRIGLETLRQVVKRNKEENIVKQLYKNGSDRAKEVAVRNCTAKSSKIEETFKDIILQYFPTAKGNHPVMGSHGFSWLIDVALPEQQIAFEYDGICWHNEERDRKRDLDLVKQGWRVVRFPYGPTPKREVLEQDFLKKARELNLL